jgi:hypothetical protein
LGRYRHLNEGELGQSSLGPLLPLTDQETLPQSWRPRNPDECEINDVLYLGCQARFLQLKGAAALQLSHYSSGP